MKKTPEEPPDRPVTKATMDKPQEEFVDDQSIPSHSDPAHDREHGDEVEPAKRTHRESGSR